MKNNYLFSIILFVGMMLIANCQPATDSKEAALSTTSYDSLKAKEYGADDYGMRKYVIAFLKEGPNRDLSPEKANELQAAHMKNIGAMADAGMLALAGPFWDEGEWRGLYIFNVETLEEAEELTNTDPAVQAGILVMELKKWYGSAALMAVSEIHDSIAKQKI